MEGFIFTSDAEGNEASEYTYEAEKQTLRWSKSSTPIRLFTRVDLRFSVLLRTFTRGRLNCELIRVHDDIIDDGHIKKKIKSLKNA